MGKKKPLQNNLIAANKKSRHDYHLEEFFEAGLVLNGWEVKSLRAGRSQLKESYVIIKNNEAWLIGAHISALESASTHVDADPLRTRKLLLNARELQRLQSATQREGYTIVPVNFHWKNNRIKIEIALAKGKKEFDKRASEKERDWNREKHRLLKIK